MPSSMVPVQPGDVAGRHLGKPRKGGHHLEVAGAGQHLLVAREEDARVELAAERAGKRRGHLAEPPHLHEVRHLGRGEENALARAGPVSLGLACRKVGRQRTSSGKGIARGSRPALRGPTARADE